MASYKVSSTVRHTKGWLIAVVLVAFAAAITAAGMPSFLKVDLTIDGRDYVLTRGTTLERVAEMGLLESPSGDFLSLDGEILEPGGGQPPVVAVNGTTAEMDDRIVGGDVLQSVRGADVVEAEITTVTAIPITITYEGAGPFVSLGSLGSAGTQEAVVGAVSGNVVGSRVITPMEPMVVQRWAPEPSGKVIALTFDDGPWPGTTDAILDVLKEHDVAATFFMIGRQVYRYPDVARRVQAEGHQIGTHTQAHTILTRASTAVVRQEISTGTKAIQDVVGMKPGWLRPPGGALSPIVTSEAQRYQLKIAMWSSDTLDWQRPPVTTLVQRIIRVDSGAIVLMHDGGGDRTATVEALGPAIRDLKKRGYRFVTLDELYGQR